jgi:hypothetical protein
MKFKVAKIQNLNQPFIQNDFDLELLEFKLRMNSQVLNILTPFLAFSNTYIHSKVHNTLSIMLDAHFQNMKAIWEHVGDLVGVDVIAKYDAKVVYLLLL